MPSISELANLSQRQETPSIMGGGSGMSLNRVQNRANTSDLDKLATDVSKIVTGIETFAQKQYDLSVDATKRMASDHLSTLEEQTTYIENDKNLSFEEKRSKIIELRQSLLEKSKGFLEDDETLRNTYDDIFSNRSKVYLSKTLSRIDNEEYILDTKIKANTANDTLLKSPVTAQWSDYLEGHKELIKLGDTTEEVVKLNFIKGKLAAVEDRYKADRTSFFKKDGTFDEESFNMYFDDEMLKDDRVSQYKTDLINAEDKILKDESDTIKESILVRSYETKTISEIDGLIDEMKTNVKHNQSKIQGLNALLAMKGKLTSDIDTNTKSELLYSIKNQVSSIENMDYGSMVNGEGFKTSTLTEKTQMLFNTIDARFPISTNQEQNAYEKAVALEKINERVDIAEYVETSDVFKPNPPTTNDKADKALNDRRVNTIDYYYRNGNLAKASELMVLNNGLPDSISKDLKQKFATGNIEEITKAVNTMVGMTQDGNMRNIFANDSKLKYLFAFTEVAKKNGLNEAEISTLQKINSGETNYATSAKKAQALISENFEKLNGEDYNELYKEANYLAALNVADEDIVELIKANREQRIYVTSDTDTEVFNAPKWASENVIDNSISILGDLVPDVKKLGAMVSKNSDNELVIKVGTKLNNSTLAIIDESTYLQMLSEYRDEQFKNRKTNQGKGLDVTTGAEADYITNMKESITSLYKNDSSIIGTLETEGITPDVIKKIKNDFKDWSNRVNKTDFTKE